MKTSTFRNVDSWLRRIWRLNDEAKALGLTPLFRKPTGILEDVPGSSPKSPHTIEVYPLGAKVEHLRNGKVRVTYPEWRELLGLDLDAEPIRFVRRHSRLEVK